MLGGESQEHSVVLEASGEGGGGLQATGGRALRRLTKAPLSRGK